ncbi:MAG: periplasmic heavy metal sensor [Chlorobiaceae bacterium]|nr:periplasmic heavy metal sensor [Chlorobiaceae bacterium]NTW73738.1 periplasmic heavy metal sensor [Chlorobiaceae bacterium]
MNDGMRPGCFPMQQALGLSDKQASRLDEMRQSHFREVQPLRQDLFRLRGELAAESVQKRPDEKRIDDLAGQIGQQHVKLAMLESRHLKQLSLVLDRKQVNTLLKMKEGRGFSKGRRW